MAARPANQASGTGTVPVKVKGGGKPKTAAARWDANKGHTKSYADHIAAMKARGTGGTAAPVQDLTTPPSYAQALQEANAAGDAQYGPQVTAAKQQAANVAPWFAEHMARVAGYATAAKQAAAPIVAGAQTFQDNTGSQMPAGLDPNSDAGKAAAMAAQGRQALAALGTQALQTNAQSTQDYFAGESNAAAKQLPQAQQAAAQNLASAEGQRGAAVTTYLTGARQNAQNYAIAQGTLGANVANQQADNANQAASAAETVRHNTASETDKAQSRKDAAAAKGESVNKYGYSAAQWQRFSAQHRQQIIKGFDKTDGTSAKDATKHAQAITKASGGVQNTITDIIGEYKKHIGQETDDTTKPIMKNGQPVKGPDGKPTYEGRKLTDKDIRAILGQNKAYTPQLIHIAVLRNQRKPLDQASIDYLHNLDPNIRIPRDWLPKQGKGAQGSGGNAPDGSGGSRPT